MDISAARSHELGEALGLLFGHKPDQASEATAHASRMIARGKLDPASFLVARVDGRIIGAIFCQPLPGSSALVWPPKTINYNPEIEDCLTMAAVSRAGTAKLMQAFLGADEVDLAGPLLRAGFRHVTRVLQLAYVPLTVPNPISTRLLLVPYSNCDIGEYQDTLIRCHDESLDCPELNGLRTTEEVLAGYRDSAPDPSKWWLARLDGNPVGIVIFGEETLDFLGIRPEYRGRGLGRELLDLAIGFGQPFSLIVDERNGPALGLYLSAGIHPVGSREVFIKLM